LIFATKKEEGENFGKEKTQNRSMADVIKGGKGKKCFGRMNLAGGGEKQSHQKSKRGWNGVEENTTGGGQR